VVDVIRAVNPPLKRIFISNAYLYPDIRHVLKQFASLWVGGNHTSLMDGDVRQQKESKLILAEIALHVFGGQLVRDKYGRGIPILIIGYCLNIYLDAVSWRQTAVFQKIRNI